MKTSLNIMKAHHGDSFLVEVFDSAGNPFTILVDGGPTENFVTTLVPELSEYGKIDLVVLTHHDRDHISGLIQYMSSSYAESNEFDIIMMNAPNLWSIGKEETQISMDEGVDLEKVIRAKYPFVRLISRVTLEEGSKIQLAEGIEMIILSPNKLVLNELIRKWPVEMFDNDVETQISIQEFHAKDFEVSFSELSLRKDIERSYKIDLANASSIAFSLRTSDFHGLFMGDAHSSIVLQGLEANYPQVERIYFDLVKLSHHGSKFNISNQFLDKIICSRYVVSTNGGIGRAKHPDRQTIAKIVCHENMKKQKTQFYFNYPLKDIESRIGKLFSDDELNQFDCLEENRISI